MAVCFGVATLFINSSPGETDDKEQQRAFESDYNIYSLPLPEKLNFAGETVPLDQFDIRERLDRELLVNTYWQSQTLLFIKRANRWFPVIEPILKEEGVPDDFKYLSLVESGYMNVVSPAGATGFWQLLKTTGSEFGLEVNKEVDERYHVEKATHAACAYLKEAHEKFGSWTVAAAAYNMGMKGFERQTERQKATNYYNLVLNSETERYVFRILALRQILNDPEGFGFNVRKKDLYPPVETQTVVLDSAVTDFADWAAQFGINYKTLKLHNPWLRDNFLTNKNGTAYTIKLPMDATLPAEKPRKAEKSLETPAGKTKVSEEK